MGNPTNTNTNINMIFKMFLAAIVVTAIVSEAATDPLIEDAVVPEVDLLETEALVAKSGDTSSSTDRAANSDEDDDTGLVDTSTSATGRRRSKGTRRRRRSVPNEVAKNDRWRNWKNCQKKASQELDKKSNNTRRRRRRGRSKELITCNRPRRI